MLRKLLVIALAITAAIVISRLSGQWDQSNPFSYFGPESFSPMFKIMLLDILGRLLPGMIIGALLGWRQVLVGALVSAIAAVAIQAFLSMHIGWAALAWSSLLITGIANGAYGSAGAALGFVLLGSNNSFKQTSD
ncbi:MAG: hypothetical protein ABI365_09450 [Lysobacteraceae bacterium]